VFAFSIFRLQRYKYILYKQIYAEGEGNDPSFGFIQSLSLANWPLTFRATIHRVENRNRTDI
jgi:hypothetical protein